MYKQAVTLASGELLHLDWGRNFSNFSLYMNGRLIGSFPDKIALKLGQRFNLPDGGQVTVILADHGLEVWQDGTDRMTGIKTGGSDHFSNAASYLVGFGILQMLFSMPAIIANDFTMVSLGTASLFVGGILIGLGIWARNTGNKLPLWIALVILLPNLGITLTIFGLILSILLIVALINGIKTGPVRKPRPQPVNADGPLDVGV